MENINAMKRRAGGGLGGLGMIAGGVAGAMAGGPMGAVKGAQMGNMAGSFLGGGDQAGPEPVGLMGQGNAMERRQKSMEGDNLFKLYKAEAALQELPEEERAQYAEPIMQAKKLEEQRRGGA